LIKNHRDCIVQLWFFFVQIGSRKHTGPRPFLHRRCILYTRTSSSSPQSSQVGSGSTTRSAAAGVGPGECRQRLRAGASRRGLAARQLVLCCPPRSGKSIRVPQFAACVGLPLPPQGGSQWSIFADLGAGSARHRSRNSNASREAPTQRSLSAPQSPSLVGAAHARRRCTYSCLHTAN
jgi:hypothetical protein